MLPAYKVERQILDESKSRICFAQRSEDGERVVLKMPREDHPYRASFERYKYEYEILRSFGAATGVVRVHALKRWKDTLALELEDFGGTSLAELMRAAPFELDEALRIAVASAASLAEVHRANVIHKDINPSNIVYNRSTGQLKLIDFDIATRLTRETPVSASPAVLEGTLAYISPEQTGRMNRSLDYRTDLYSLGATLYQLLTRRLPFGARDPMALVHAHIALEPPPPAEVAPRIPKPVSDIVMKLLSKRAEDRYQSASGLKSDLERCAEELRRTGGAAGFALGQHDIPERFDIPERLYGREADREALLCGFRQAKSGKRKLTLISGSSGMGKSSLVCEIHKPVTEEHGYFAEGKFEQFQRNTPYFALVNAFRSLARQLLSESEPRIEEFRRRILARLGWSIRIIGDVIPEIEAILDAGAPAKGPRVDLQQINPTELQSRFNLAFKSLLQAFCQPEHPVALFLDDLQWIDAASLKLLKFLLTDDDIKHLHVIGAYRSNEIDATHPLMDLVQELKRQADFVDELRLSPLSLPEVAMLIADALRSPAAAVVPLAELVARKTGGNPLFVRQMLRHLHQEGHLRLDARGNRWAWDLPGIASLDFTSNVVELMLARLQGLPSDTRQALQLAACIGHEFDLETLSLVHERPTADIYQSLAPALAAEIILPASRLQGDEDESRGYHLVVSRFTFLHDRVQQAAYSLLDDEQKALAHLKIGRQLLAKAPEEELTERVFAIVDHLDNGRRLIRDPEEKRVLAGLNLKAGMRARSAVAYAAARDYFDVGIECLAADAWSSCHDLAFELHRQRAEADYLNGNLEESQSQLRLLMTHARTAVAKAELYNLLIVQYTIMTRYGEAIAAGREVLRLLDIELPSEDLRAAFEAEIAEVEKLLEGREIASLVDCPEASRPDIRLALRTISNIGPLTAIADSALWQVCVAKAIHLSLLHGLAPDGTYCWSCYGILLVTGSGNFKAAYEFGALALALSERFNNRFQKCIDAAIIGHYLSLWVKPIHTIPQVYEDGYQAGLDSGNLQWAGYTLSHKMVADFYRGADLRSIMGEVPKLLSFSDKTGNVWLAERVTAYELALLRLTETGQGAVVSSYRGMREPDYLRLCDESQNLMVSCEYALLMLQVEYLHGNWSAALGAARRAEQLLHVILGAIPTASYYFFASLAAAAVCAPSTGGEGEGEERRRHLDRILTNQKQMKTWADSCKENFLHRYLLVEAEVARIQGRDAEAMQLYCRSIQLARQHDFVQDEALANELAGRFSLERGLDDYHALHIAQAYQGYERWGALGKAEALASQYPDLVSGNASRPPPHGTVTRTSGAVATQALDWSSVVKAYQAISSEIVLPTLLGRLIRIAIENAGAQRGCLLLMHNDDLSIEAEADVAWEEARVQPSPLDSSGGVPRSVVNYVKRTRQPVFLEDATAAGELAADDYLATARPRSLLCLPLVKQGALVGMLYLEHKQVAGAFTQERLSLIEMLASQAAIALENARLYQEMEQRVRERTAQLEAANRELQSFSYSVSHDLRAPLRTLDLFSEELSRALGSEASAEALSHLARVQKAAARMDELIEDMLKLAQVARSDLNRQTVDLGAIAREISADLRRAEPDRDVEIVIAERLRVEADPRLLRIVMDNLLGNAWKFTGAHPRARIEVGVAEQPDGRPAYFVRDDGAGFDMEFAHKLFTPFRRLHSASEFAGTGVGLATVQRVIHRHGGRVWAESAVERGATLYFTLSP